MEVSKISGRYAKAMYEYARDNKQENILFEELHTIAGIYLALPRMKDVLENPTVENSEKLSFLKNSVGKDISDACVKSLELIIENGRLDYIYSIILMYDKIYREDKRILYSRLISAKPVDDKTKEALARIIAKNNETVEFITEVKNDLIGGFILEIEDNRLDASVRNQFNEMRKRMLK